MCLVPSWSPYERQALDSEPQIEALHVDEALLYALADARIDILVTIVVAYREGPPLNLHLTHRRGITFEDATSTLLGGENVVASLVRSTLADRMQTYENDAQPELLITPLGTPGREAIKTRIPLRELASEEIRFTPDLSENADVEEQSRPFTTCTFGPINANPSPMVFRVAVAITNPAFGALVHKVNQYGCKYYYDVSGPEVILRDLRLDDLYALSRDLASVYKPVFESRIKNTYIPVPSYDVLTFDKPGAVYAYTRVMARAEHVLRDESIHATARPGEEWLVNAWHSDAADFLIVRRGVVSASAEGLGDVETSLMAGRTG